MATRTPEVDLSGIRDPQKYVALLVGVVLVVVGVAGLTGVLDGDVVGRSLDVTVLGDGLVLGVFGVPVWLGVTAIVAGLLGVELSRYGGGATTFDKVAAGLVLPPVLFLAVVDWALAVGTIPSLAVGVVALLLAVVFVVVGVVLLFRHPLALVFPVVALLAVADWALSLTEMAPAGAAVNLPTIGLLVVLAVSVGAIGFEGGRRLT